MSGAGGPQPPPADAAAPTAPFGRRGARWLAAIAAGSLAASGVLAAFSDAFEVPSFGTDTFSRSAIGHHALVALLRDLGRTVLVSRSRTADKGEGAVVVLAEPRLGPAGLDTTSAERLEAIAEAAPRLLVVLPKRTGLPDRIRPRWIGAAQLVPEAEAARALEAAGVEGTVVRPSRAIAGWRGELPVPALDQPQLVRSDDLVPLLWTDEGMLVGERVDGGAHLVVLADPDLLATHGLGAADNAAIAVGLLDRLGAAAGAPIVVDETLHGLEAQPSLARELLRWPLVLATIQAALALALLAWIALVRFGPPRPGERALAPGKAFLVENTAALLRHGGDPGYAAVAYLRAAKEQIAHALRAPGERPPDLDRWVAALAAARQREGDLAAVERRVAEAAGRRGRRGEILEAALAVHRFREEMTDGARKDP